ncbi:pyridoxal-phosphate dependent enzyme [Actinomadura graeca]|uniref:Pyridoxal-phosphate dependent enzyme n=1 Tax=Actinomadura graeca TaxID=2750812 RepID=A0ABX8QWV8_9ACTN|nr:pyridoxal-phosphate dependent enzyme [Actinomadura graeca]QXJ23103.1 pyridoxal-phosphate dependent enzyme [Actinomadura graeca]
MHVSDSLIGLVGGTPLLRLRGVLGGGHRDGGAPLVAAKVEYFNPGGSVKDRIAVRMVEAAERAGDLREGGAIVEATTGNTGIGLAIVARERGYRCLLVCPDTISADGLGTLRAYGAEVVVCPAAVPPGDPASCRSVSDRLVRQTSGAWRPDQYSNPHNPLSHYETTGPEIWAQTDGRVTHFVAGIGTGGTVTGAGGFLKEVSGGCVRVIGAEPRGPARSGGTGRSCLVEGVGEDARPAAFDPGVCDEVIAVGDGDAFAATRRLAREEGLLVGGSGGLAVVAARAVAAGAGPEDVIVVLLPDGGRGYLSTIFDDAWMAAYGFPATPPGSAGSAGSPASPVPEEARVGRVLARKAALGCGTRAALVHVRPRQTVGTAVSIMREHDVSQLPVLRAEPPLAAAADVVGSVTERGLLDALVRGEAGPGSPVEDHMASPFPIVGSGEPAGKAAVLLERHGAALVLDDGRPVGLITAQDLLAHLADADEPRAADDRPEPPPG